MDHKSEQHYGSTLSFSIACSDFRGSNSTLPIQTIVRTFNKKSTNLSQYGSWNCVFEESKKQHQKSIELQLTLSWVTNAGLSTETGYQRHGAANELMSRIRSIKIRSDSTLSELLVTQLDGRCLLEGEFIRVRLQSDRVLKNGRYKFRIGFYTKDISGSNPFDHPLFMPILDIDPDFDPVGCRPNESPDVTFQFPCSNPSGIPTIIMAHSSVIKRSQYFAHRVAEVVEKKTREGIPFNGITCEITEFTSSVFRVMLQFLYLGRLRFKNISDKVEQESGYSTSSPAMGELPKTRAYRSNPTGQEKHIWRLEKVYFGDLFRIAERYGIPALCTLSLRGMQCTLSMSIAIAMLANLPCSFSSAPEGLNEHKKDNEGCKNEGSMSNIQIKLARDIIKEYMRFIMEVTIPRQSFKEPVSREKSLEILQHLGDCVLESIEYIWD